MLLNVLNYCLWIALVACLVTEIILFQSTSHRINKINVGSRTILSFRGEEGRDISVHKNILEEGDSERNMLYSTLVSMHCDVNIGLGSSILGDDTAVTVPNACERCEDGGAAAPSRAEGTTANWTKNLLLVVLKISIWVRWLRQGSMLLAMLGNCSQCWKCW